MKFTNEDSTAKVTAETVPDLNLLITLGLGAEYRLEPVSRWNRLIDAYLPTDGPLSFNGLGRVLEKRREKRIQSNPDVSVARDLQTQLFLEPSSHTIPKEVTGDAADLAVSLTKHFLEDTAVYGVRADERGIRMVESAIDLVKAAGLIDAPEQVVSAS